MRKSFKVLITILIICAVCAGCAAFWYTAPKTFLKGVSPSEISEITVFDGTNGKHFSVTKSEEIEKIITSVQSVKMKRNRISVGYSGFSLNLSFKDKSGVITESFIMNGDTVIRDDPFFYDCNSGLGFDYLKELENIYAE